MWYHIETHNTTFHYCTVVANATVLACHHLLPITHQIPHTTCPSPLATRLLLLATRYLPHTASHLPLATHPVLQHIVRCPPAPSHLTQSLEVLKHKNHCLLHTTAYYTLLTTAYYLRHTTAYYTRLTICYFLLLTAYCLLLTTHFLLFATGECGAEAEEDREERHQGTAGEHGTALLHYSMCYMYYYTPPLMLTPTT